MSSHIKSEIEKPEWFDLENYHNSFTANFQQWQINLEIRIWIIAILNSPDIDNSVEVNLENIKSCRIHGFFINQGRHKMPPIIHSLTNDNYASIQAVLTKNIKTIFEENSQKEESTTDDIIKKLPSIMDDLHSDESEFKTKFCHARINIDAPTTELIKEFKLWIKEQKTKYNRNNKPKITVNKMEHWANAEVIPYLDLFIWREEK